jgi:hypothetical protein
MKQKVLVNVGGVKVNEEVRYLMILYLVTIRIFLPGPQRRLLGRGTGCDLRASNATQCEMTDPQVPAALDKRENRILTAPPVAVNASCSAPRRVVGVVNNPVNYSRDMFGDGNHETPGRKLISSQMNRAT